MMRFDIWNIGKLGCKHVEIILDNKVIFLIGPVCVRQSVPGAIVDCDAIAERLSSATVLANPKVSFVRIVDATDFHPWLDDTATPLMR